MPFTTARTSRKASAPSPRSATPCGRGVDMSSPRPTEPGILAFIAEVDSHYPPKSVEAPIEKQRERYDALCRGFDAPLPAGLSTSAETAPHPEAPVPPRSEERRVGKRGVKTGRS